MWPVVSMAKSCWQPVFFQIAKAFYFLVTFLKLLDFCAIWTVVCYFEQLPPQGLSDIQNGGTRCKIVRHFEYRRLWRTNNVIFMLYDVIGSPGGPHDATYVSWYRKPTYGEYIESTTVFHYEWKLQVVSTLCHDKQTRINVFDKFAEYNITASFKFSLHSVYIHIDKSQAASMVLLTLKPQPH